MIIVISTEYVILTAMLASLLLEQFSYTVADETYNIPPHSHNCYQWYCVLEGETVFDVDGQKISLQPGESLIIPPGAKRHPRCGAVPPVYIFALFDIERPDFAGCVLEVLKCSAEQRRLLYMLAEELQTPKDGNSDFYIQGLFLALLAGLCRLHRKRQAARATGPQSNTMQTYEIMITQLDTFIRNNLHRPIGRKDLADVAHVSSPHLARIYRSCLEMTPLQRITQLRMEQACKLLQNSTISITQIALSIGYDSFSHFSRTFRKHTGLTPRDYRKDVSSLR